MQNVSQPRSGQSLFAVGLRFALGAMFTVTSFSLIASQSAPDERASGTAMQSGAPSADENRVLDVAGQRRLQADAPTNRRDGAIRSDGAPAARGDRSGLRRALTDSNNSGAVIQRTEMSREERKALRRELRDAMQGANEGRGGAASAGSSAK